MFYRKKENEAKDELYKLYKEACKCEGDLFTVLRKSLEDNLSDDVSNKKWNTYKMVCENYSFLAFNLAVISAMSGICAISFDEFRAIAAIVAIAVGVWAIVMHEKERMYKYLKYVLDAIKK